MDNEEERRKKWRVREEGRVESKRGEKNEN